MHVNVTPLLLVLCIVSYSQRLITVRSVQILSAVQRVCVCHETRSWPCSLQKASLEMLFRETH